MKHRYLILVLFIMLFAVKTSNGQIKISEVIQESKIASTDNNKLYFVDFWATWCGPCVYAKEMLTVLQKQYPEDLYVISISQEAPQKVEKYLQKKPSELAVVIDFDGETFYKHTIKPLPYGILFDANGNQLWKGHPSDLTAGKLRDFISQHQRTSNIYDFLKVKQFKENTKSNKEYKPNDVIEYKKLRQPVEALSVSNFDTHIKLTGHLKSILSHLSRIYSKQIQIPTELNSSYEVFIKKPFNNTDNLAYTLIKKLGYYIHNKEITDNVLILELINPVFWDVNQIDWGMGTPKYLIGDDEITADNATLKDVTYNLANALNMPVIILNEDERSFTPHDWKLHFKYYQFMENNFNDYGIEIKKEKSKISLYIITKKAP